jgi:hypothetical protein
MYARGFPKDAYKDGFTANLMNYNADKRKSEDGTSENKSESSGNPGAQIAHYPFSKDEDDIIKKAVGSFDGDTYTDWHWLASKVPGRTGKQVKERWENHLERAIFGSDDVSISPS